MLMKMITGAVFAGLAAGLVAVVLQFAFVQELILQSELYESGELDHFAVRGAGHDAMHHGTQDSGDASSLEETSGDDTPKPEDAHAHDAETGGHHGSEEGALMRNGLSVIFSIFTYVGLGLMLVAGFAFAETRGIRITARSGLLWGLAGFVAVQFAPAFGLPPEVPGNAAADITVRQIWWISTVVATALGLALIGYGRNWMHWGLAIVAILLPHLIGAPHPGEYWGSAPPELAATYAARTLGVGMAAWLVLGLVAGYFWHKDES